MRASLCARLQIGTAHTQNSNLRPKPQMAVIVLENLLNPIAGQAVPNRDHLKTIAVITHEPGSGGALVYVPGAA